VTTSLRALSTVLVVAALAAAYAVLPLLDRPAVDDGFVIDRFDRQVVVGSDGIVDVTETLEVTFLEGRRGIFRDLEPTGIGGLDAEYEIASVDRGTDGDAWRWLVEEEDGDTRVRIGDERVELSPGPQTYRLRYRASGQTATDAAAPDTVEARIDVPGTAWPVPVAETSLTVELPVGAEEVVCVVGDAGDSRPCEPAEMDGTTVVQTLPPLEPATTGTVSVRMPADAFEAGGPPARDLEPLVATPGGTAPLEVPDPWRGLLIGLATLLPLAVFEGLRGRFVYRDRVTDPVLHDQPVPTAELAPPDGLAPVDLATVLQRVGDDDDRFLAMLVGLEQRGVLSSHTTTDADTGAAGGSAVGDDVEVDEVVLTTGPTPDEAEPYERAFVDALFDGSDGVRFDGEYDEDVAARVVAAKAVLAARDTELRRPGAGLVHDGGRWLRGGRGLLAGTVASLLAVGAGVAAAWAVGVGVPVVGTVLVTALAWGALAGIWRYQRQAFTSRGRLLSARTRAYRHYLGEVHGDQLAFAADRGIDQRHPAVALLPYAIVLGLGDSWYDRFGPVLREMATSAPASGGATVPWWAYAGGYAGFRSTQSASVTDPAASSGAGGGGAGSGGGGGGGGSW
jgi:hypothetical protein